MVRQGGEVTHAVLTTWDYFDRWDEFAPWLDDHGGTRFFNSPKLVRWNLDKHYLHDLELAGVQVVQLPTSHRRARAVV